MIRDTTPTFTFKWGDGVDVDQIVDVCVSFYQKKTDHLLPLHYSDGRVLLALDGVTVTLTQEETLAFSKGTCQIQLKLKFIDGTVWGSDFELEDIEDVLHEEVF